jgi:hypothetical protein
MFVGQVPQAIFRKADESATDGASASSGCQRQEFGFPGAALEVDDEGPAIS